MSLSERHNSLDTAAENRGHFWPASRLVLPSNPEREFSEFQEVWNSEPLPASCHVPIPVGDAQFSPFSGDAYDGTVGPLEKDPRFLACVPPIQEGQASS